MLRAESEKLLSGAFFSIFLRKQVDIPTKSPRMFYSELFNMKQSSIEQLLMEQSLFKQFYNEQMGTAAKGKGGKKQRVL